MKAPFVENEKEIYKLNDIDIEWKLGYHCVVYCFLVGSGCLDFVSLLGNKGIVAYNRDYWGYLVDLLCQKIIQVWGGCTSFTYILPG